MPRHHQHPLPSSPQRVAWLARLALFVLLSGVARGAEDGRVSPPVSTGKGLELGNAVPGILTLERDEAFALLRDANLGIVAAGAVTETGGRAVAFAHDAFLKEGDLPDRNAVAELVKRSIRWAGASERPRVGLEPGLEALGKALAEAGFAVEPMPPEELAADRIDVYCARAQRNLTERGAEGLAALLRQGGGIVLAATPWAFAGAYPDFRDFPANLVLAEAGIRFHPDRYASKRAPLSFGASDLAAELLGDPAAALAREAAAAARRLAAEHLTISERDRDELIASLRAGIDLRGADLPPFLESLRALNEAVGPIVPTRERPLVPGRDPLVDAIVRLEGELDESLPAGRMYALPAADDYPGAVPAGAERTTRTVAIDGKWRGWLEGRGAGGWAAKELRPTGLYAAPGETIVVTAPAGIAGRGFEVVVGAYGGGLDQREQWHRYPRLQRRIAIDGPTTAVSNALGGLVAIAVPRGAEEGELSFAIAGGVEAPLYQHGRTDPETWRSEIRNHPAPWAELASDRVILALPSDYVRRLDDPGALMEVWNGIVEASAELARADRRDHRAERLVFDRQTSAGSMHSGYPIAAHLGEAAAKAVDARRLREEGDWGFFHELGHNHQHDLWFLPGTGETTCNLWSVYLFEEYVGKSRDQAHPSMAPLSRRQRIQAYHRKGRDFEREWTVWTALEAYLQVQERFGWEPFKMVFAEYNRLAGDERPRSQQERNDQWVLRLSRACGRNLAPFWAAWNLPLSESVHRDLADLPLWEDHPAALLLE